MSGSPPLPFYQVARCLPGSQVSRDGVDASVRTRRAALVPGYFKAILFFLLVSVSSVASPRSVGKEEGNLDFAPPTNRGKIFYLFCLTKFSSICPVQADKASMTRTTIP